MRPERGAATVATAVVSAFLVLVAVVLVEGGSLIAMRHRAAAAADDVRAVIVVTARDPGGRLRAAAGELYGAPTRTGDGVEVWLLPDPAG